MCGIIGFKSTETKSVNDIIIKGLKRLEYRGYDSFGLSWFDDKTHGFRVIKKVGKIGDFNLDSEIFSKVGFGHTRWATHGKVSEENAHPHFSNNKRIGVVHNGIIENFQEIKSFLEKQGFVFYSETDTEVIPNLIEYFIKQGLDFVSACKKTFNKLEGSFAIVVIYQESDEEVVMVGARDGSPLVLGVSDDLNTSRTYYFGSDIPAFLEHTNKVVFLDDGEMVVLKEIRKGEDKTDKDKVRIIPEFINYKKDKVVDKEVKIIDWSIEQAEKGDYEHFMMKEIDEQKFTIKAAIKQDPELINNVINLMKESVGIFFVGAGTSYHACKAASYVFSHIAKKHVNVVLASEFPNYEDFIIDKTLVVAVSQSGETADVLEAVKTAKKKGARVVAIVNVVGSTLTRLADYSIMMNAGPEICVLSTKSYTSQLAIIIMLAFALSGKTSDGKELIEKVAALVPDIIDENKEKLKELASMLKDKHDIFLIGRNSDYATALEGALKIKEVSYIHAEGFAGGELKHGTIALIEQGTPVIAFVSEHIKQLTLSNAMEVKSRGAFVIGVAQENNEVFDYFIKIPELGIGNLILMIIPIQILAYYLAVFRNLDPDKPRNLAKSVTVK